MADRKRVYASSETIDAIHQTELNSMLKKDTRYSFIELGMPNREAGIYSIHSSQRAMLNSISFETLGVI